MQSKRLETGSEAHIISINPSTLAAKIVTAIPALDIQSVNWGRTHRQFRLLSISNDGVNLYLTKSQITGRQDFSFIQITELQAVDLSRGTVTPVARIKNIEADSLGLDWRDKSQTLSPRSR
jgi:hypothetical protein